MILDTSFLIDVIRGNPDVKEWEEKLSHGHVGSTTTISVMELWEGTLLARASQAEQDRVSRLLSDLRVIGFDAQSARRAAEIDVALVERGRQSTSRM